MVERWFVICCFITSHLFRTFSHI